MERYKLKDLFENRTEYTLAMTTAVAQNELLGLTMGLSATSYGTTLTFILASIYGYFYDDEVAYVGESAADIKSVFIERLCYDITVKLPYWYKKYQYIAKLLTTNDLSLMQTSKVTSSSSDETNSTGGSLQKVATTPSGVSSGTAEDSIDIEIAHDSGTLGAEITTAGFVDKYSNSQQKYASANKIAGSRSGEILREGSIDELINVLEKLPSSFADEITKELGKHFIFVY